MVIDPSMRILVVDDFATMRQMIRRILRAIGFTDIEEAEDGKIALANLRQRKFDFVVSDWNMPNMKGIELVRSSPPIPSSRKPLS